MPRVTKSATAKARHKKILKSTKGHYGARSRLFKTAKQSNIKSLQYAFRDRKNRKRSFRALWIARINAGLESCLYLGNLDSKRDWGHAKDYVIMQWLMLQQDKPEDFVIASGRMETVWGFVEISAKFLNWNTDPNEPAIIWKGEGLNEVGIRADNNKIVVRIDPRYFRPTEVNELLGNASKAKNMIKI